MPDRAEQLSFSGFDDEENEAAAQLNDNTSGAVVDTGTATTQDPIEQLKGSTVYAIDAHSLIFQVFHAIPEMTSPRGEPVSAVFGFTRDIFFLLEEKKPDYLVVAFDLPGTTFRHDMYSDYKVDRGEMPDDLRPQIPAIRQMLGALGIPVLEYENYEADDVLATVARICDRAEANCLLVTNDKDCRQLITDHVKLYNVRKDLVYDGDTLMADWGVRPDQVVDFQALVGDSVDNVPGVPLIGPKIARQLLETYGTLDEVLDHADEVAGAKRQQNLREGRETALLSRELVRLDDAVPVEVDWSAARLGPIDVESARELFATFGFRSLSDRLQNFAPAPVAEWKSDYRTVATPEALAELVAQLQAQPQISFDMETTHVSPRWAEPVGYAFSFRAGQAFYIPVRAPEGQPQLEPASTLAALRPVLENAKIEKVGQNLKYDMIVLRAAGGKLAGIAFDTMVASYLLEAGQRNHNLDELSKRYLHHETTKIAELIGSGKKQKRMDEVPVERITQYAGEDADVPLRLRPMLQEQLDQLRLNELYQDLELPLIDVLAELEFNGIRVDTARLAELSERYQQRLVKLEAEIYELADGEFNIASPKQLAQILFDRQKLPVLKKTKTGPSTDVDVLEQLAKQHPLPAKIIEYRQFAKLKNTYVDALPALVHPETGRVHASFNQVVAATGRLSSSDPNLQNIPVRTESGREIRAAFLPGEDGWQLLAADYSQIELRVLAHFCGDDNLCAAFERDEDIHALVASQVNDVPLADVTPDMRRSAKAVNFGVIYGQSPFGLAKALDIEREVAAEFIDSYFANYPQVDRFLDEILLQARKDGYVTTILGRRRMIQGIRSKSSGRQRNLAERTAINTVIQGSAADLIKRAMIHIFRRMRREPLQSRMLLQIHDELIFEVPPAEVGIMAQLVEQEMAGAAELLVPLKIDIKLGANWAEVEPV